MVCATPDTVLCKLLLFWLQGSRNCGNYRKEKEKKKDRKRKDIVATDGMFYHQFSDGYILQQTWKLVKTNSNKSPAEDPSHLPFPVRMTGS